MLQENVIYQTLPRMQDAAQQREHAWAWARVPVRAQASNVEHKAPVIGRCHNYVDPFQTSCCVFTTVW